MALIVENGTGVAGANSYATTDAHRAYAAARGVVLGIDADIETKNALAIDYLEGKRNKFSGSKVNPLQALQYPRYGVSIDGYAMEQTYIPLELIKANSQLILEQQNGVNIMPTQNEPSIKSESIGPIKTEYAINPGSFFEPFIASVETLLEPLYKSGSTGFGLQTLRV